MKYVIGLLVMLYCSGLSYGQIKAVTDKGDEVILYTDGTWKVCQTDLSGFRANKLSVY